MSSWCFMLPFFTRQVTCTVPPWLASAALVQIQGLFQGSVTIFYSSIESPIVHRLTKFCYLLRYFVGTELFFRRLNRETLIHFQIKVFFQRKILTDNCLIWKGRKQSFLQDVMVIECGHSQIVLFWRLGWQTWARDGKGSRCHQCKKRSLCRGEDHGIVILSWKVSLRKPRI